MDGIVEVMSMASSSSGRPSSSAPPLLFPGWLKKEPRPKISNMAPIRVASSRIFALREISIKILQNATTDKFTLAVPFNIIPSFLREVASLRALRRPVRIGST